MSTAKNMRALIIEKPGTAVVKEVPIPQVGDHDVLIRVMASGICGTDIHIYRGEYLGSYPVIPGHEFAGTVEKVGSKVSRFKVGDRVAIEPNISCDNCESCLNNRQNFCLNWNGVGVTLPGGMAEYAVVPEKATFSIGDLPFEVGAFVEPLSCVLYGVERTRIELADKVLILGAGPIGLLLAQSIMLQGAKEITQVDRNTKRLEKAKANGAARVESSLDALPLDYYDVVVDASGAIFLMEQTIRFVRKGGTILLFGVPPKEAKVSFPAFTVFEKGLYIVSSYTSVRNSIQAVGLLETGRLDVAPLISHRLPLEQFTQGIDFLEQGTDDVMKVLITP
ncbi:zinc-dependent alcohol dehydrogenase family protein [Pleomorphochaeta sp. DL1XJH-081]|uniref:zinc-dependent alcohol dehydrogenase family protein n=1 Tax=Pleomorphochaeta sp. DL1XJH-081 TaxID=3409690 RepID=UPI003BB4B950